MASAKIPSVNKRSAAALAYVVKWLVVPIVLAALGFFFVGPRLASPAKPVPSHTGNAQSENTSGKPKRVGEPQVEVNASPVRRITPVRAKRKKDQQKVEGEAPAGGTVTPPPTSESHSNAEETTPVGGGKTGATFD